MNASTIPIAPPHRGLHGHRGGAEKMCVPLRGFTGRVIVTTVAVMTVVLYLLKYHRERTNGSERRTFLVFVFDVSKILIGASVAWVFLIAASLLLGAADPSAVDSADLSADPAVAQTSVQLPPLAPIAWYFPALILESTIGTLIGVALGRLVNFASRAYVKAVVARRSGRDQAHVQHVHSGGSRDDVLKQYHEADGDGGDAEPEGWLWWLAVRNAYYGKYSVQHHPAAVDHHHATPDRDYAADVDGDDGAQDTALASWWAAQLFTWCLCVAVSRVCVMLLLWAVNTHVSMDLNPFFALAEWVDHLDVSCAAKQIGCFGVARLFIDLAVIAVTDQWNRLKPRAE